MIAGRRLPGPGFNWRLIIPVVSGVLGAVALGMLVVAAYALVDGDASAAEAFALPGAVGLPLAALGLAGAMRLRSIPIRARDGFLAVTLAWLAAAVAGAFPFVLEETHPRFVDAMFESMAGFTTTGSSLIDPDSTVRPILLWRSLSQWLGGVGIVVLVVAIAPATGLATQRLFHAEMSGVTAERLTPRIAETAKIICGVYIGLTVAGFVAYSLAGMGTFDALNHILTTISSGGYSTRSESIGAFDSVPIELVAIVFMIASGINFAFYWRAVRGRSLFPQAAEVRAFLLIIVGGSAAITASLLLADGSGDFWESLRSAAFTVTAVSSGTGLVIEDYDQWNDFARSHLLLLMLIGGCAGSTSGGIKVVRIMLLGKTISQELARQLRPSAVQVLRTRGQVFSEDVRRGVLAFVVVYLALALVGMFVLLGAGLDMLAAATASASVLSLLGTGLGEAGPTENFAAVPEGARGFLMFLMLAGRLEVFTVLVILTPAFWRRNVA